MKYSEGELSRAHEKMKEIRRREAAGERGPGERQALAKISEGLEQLRHLGYEVIDYDGLTSNGKHFPGEGDGLFVLSIKRREVSPSAEWNAKWTDREILDFLDRPPPSGTRWRVIGWPPRVFPCYVDSDSKEGVKSFRRVVCEVLDDMQAVREEEKKEDGVVE